MGGSAIKMDGVSNQHHPTGTGLAMQPFWLCMCKAQGWARGGGTSALFISIGRRSCSQRAEHRGGRQLCFRKPGHPVPGLSSSHVAEESHNLELQKATPSLSFPLSKASVKKQLVLGFWTASLVFIQIATFMAVAVAKPVRYLELGQRAFWSCTRAKHAKRTSTRSWRSRG